MDVCLFFLWTTSCDVRAFCGQRYVMFMLFVDLCDVRAFCGSLFVLFVDSVM